MTIVIKDTTPVVANVNEPSPGLEHKIIENFPETCYYLRNPMREQTPVSGGAVIAAALEAEHEVLRGMWHELRAAVASDDSAALIARLEEFITFCGEHFEHEEESLIRYKEMGRKRHVAGHQLLMDQLSSVRREMGEDSRGETANALADWWVAFRNHMHDCDRPALERLVAGTSGEEASERVWQFPEPSPAGEG